MKKIANPNQGTKFNRMHPPTRDCDFVSVTESLEERLTVVFGLGAEVDRLKDLDVPASFKTKPGHLDGVKLAQMGVAGLCKNCGALVESENPNCKDHPVTD